MRTVSFKEGSYGHFQPNILVLNIIYLGNLLEFPGSRPDFFLGILKDTSLIFHHHLRVIPNRRWMLICQICTKNMSNSMSRMAPCTSTFQSHCSYEILLLFFQPSFSNMTYVSGWLWTDTVYSSPGNSQPESKLAQPLHPWPTSLSGRKTLNKMFPNIVVSQNGWVYNGKPYFSMDDLGKTHYFQKHPNIGEDTIFTSIQGVEILLQRSVMEYLHQSINGPKSLHERWPFWAMEKKHGSLGYIRGLYCRI